VGDYLPDLKRPAANASLLQLLSHTSGIRDVDSLRMLTRSQDESTVTSDDALAAIYRQTGVNFPAGTDFAYSNSNYVLLARIVELVEGKPYSEVLRRRITEPLALTATRQRDRYDEVIPLRATPYGGGSEKPIVQNVNWTLIGTSSLQSTAGDLVRWLELLMSAKDSRGSLAKLQASGNLIDGRSTSYGGGLVHDRFRGMERFTHNGGSGGFRSTLAAYPQRPLALAVLCNSSAIFPSALADEVADVLLGTRKPQPVPGQAPTAISGTYYDQGLDAFRWIEPSSEGLLLKSSTADRGRLFRWTGDGTFVDDSGNVLRPGSGGLTLDDGLRFGRPYRKLTSSPQGTIPEHAFRDYTSPDLDVLVSLEKDAQGPFVRLKPAEVFTRASDTVERRLLPAPDGAFMTPNGWIIRFPRNGVMTISLGRLTRFPLFKGKDEGANER
jgi:hypothetical protein